MSTDVIVIGGGVIGLSTAYQLVKAGKSVRLIDAGATGQQASWASAGVISAVEWSVSAEHAKLQRAGHQLYPEFCKAVEADSGMSVQFVESAGIKCIIDEADEQWAAEDLAASEGVKTRSGEPVLQRLDAAEVRRREPAVTEDVRGGLYAADTSQVRNPRLMRALAVACRKLGVEIIENQPVSGLHIEGGRVLGVCCGPIIHEAGHVVLAAGAWSGRIDPRIADLVPVHPVRGQIVLMETTPPLFSHVISHEKCYLVPRLDGRILLGATEEHEAGFDTSNTAGGVARLITDASRMVPAIADARLIRCWAGLRPGTPDRHPFLGPVPGFDGLIAACGHFRTGLVLPALTGIIIRDLIEKGTCDWNLTPFAPGRSFS